MLNADDIKNLKLLNTCHFNLDQTIRARDKVLEKNLVHLPSKKIKKNKKTRKKKNIYIYIKKYLTKLKNQKKSRTQFSKYFTPRNIYTKFISLLFLLYPGTPLPSTGFLNSLGSLNSYLF